jgi:hypothetical protein
LLKCVLFNDNFWVATFCFLPLIDLLKINKVVVEI